jgi:hypothetical protein
MNSYKIVNYFLKIVNYWIIKKSNFKTLLYNVCNHRVFNEIILKYLI